MTKKFIVIIEETVSDEFEVCAETETDALEIAKKNIAKGSLF